MDKGVNLQYALVVHAFQPHQQSHYLRGLDGKEANHRCRLGCSKIDCPNIDDSDLTDGATLEGFLEEKKETCTYVVHVEIQIQIQSFFCQSVSDIPTNTRYLL